MFLPRNLEELHKTDYHPARESVHIWRLKYGIGKCLVMLPVKYYKHMFVRK